MSSKVSSCLDEHKYSVFIGGVSLRWSLSSKVILSGGVIEWWFFLRVSTYNEVSQPVYVEMSIARFHMHRDCSLFRPRGSACKREDILNWWVRFLSRLKSRYILRIRISQPIRKVSQRTRDFLLTYPIMHRHLARPNCYMRLYIVQYSTGESDALLLLLICSLLVSWMLVKLDR
jgi:hypothetical protein